MNIIQKTFMKAAAKGFRPTMKNAYLTQGDLYKAFYKKNGKEALPIIAEIASKAGVERAKIMQQMMPVRDMKGVGELFKNMDAIMEMGMQVIELSDDKVRITNPGCIFGLEGTSQELCEAMTNTEKNMISTLLGQEVEAKIVKSIAAGDRECEVIFAIK